MVRRLGNFQRTVLKGIKREGKQPVSIKKGFSRQVKSLRKRQLIKKKGNFFVLTKKGTRRIKRI